MSNQEDFVSFEKALRDLQMRSEELRKLVSEGEIRAFRDGSSMKFRREDIDNLNAVDDLSDSLEDDTGMVTEELSEEDTLLVADDDEIEEIAAAAPSSAVTAGSTRGSRIRAAADEQQATEPAWVTGAAIVGAVFMIWGFMVAYSIATGADPNGLTGLLSFAK
ncbi:MAG: hypothetical protein KDB80_05225 [Planctomycetes bacterium]|nr:hypothetical protein [Planctomycetota bacterium]